jgi:hypothetical protein
VTATSHALTGAIIATVVKKPWLAIPLAFLSHFVCDALPHFGIVMSFGSPNMYTWLLIDGLAAVTFAIFLVKKGVNSPVLLAVCGFAAMSPDLAWLYYGLNGQLNNIATLDPVSHFHAVIQWFQHPIGIIVELFWITIMVVLILRFNNEDNKIISTG